MQPENMPGGIATFGYLEFKVRRLAEQQSGTESPCMGSTSWSDMNWKTPRPAANSLSQQKANTKPGRNAYEHIERPAAAYLQTTLRYKTASQTQSLLASGFTSSTRAWIVSPGWKRNGPSLGNPSVNSWWLKETKKKQHKLFTLSFSFSLLFVHFFIVFTSKKDKTNRHFMAFLFNITASFLTNMTDFLKFIITQPSHVILQTQSFLIHHSFRFQKKQPSPRLPEMPACRNSPHPQRHHRGNRSASLCPPPSRPPAKVDLKILKRSSQ